MVSRVSLSISAGFPGYASGNGCGADFVVTGLPVLSVTVVGERLEADFTLTRLPAGPVMVVGDDDDVLAKRVEALETWEELLRADLATVRCIFADIEGVVLAVGRSNGQHDIS